jgi:hypothetical protein
MQKLHVIEAQQLMEWARTQLPGLIRAAESEEERQRLLGLLDTLGAALAENDEQR